jgi:hypothetical protein
MKAEDPTHSYEKVLEEEARYGKQPTLSYGAYFRVTKVTI